MPLTKPFSWPSLMRRAPRASADDRLAAARHAVEPLRARRLAEEAARLLAAGALAGHAALEAYSVLTRLPVDDRVAPVDAESLLAANFSIVEPVVVSRPTE